MNRNNIEFFPSLCPVQYVRFTCYSPGTRKKTLKNITGGWDQSTFLILEVKGHNHPDNDSNSAIILGDFKNVLSPPTDKSLFSIYKADIITFLFTGPR